jgi:hypothetical protein
VLEAAVLAELPDDAVELVLLHGAALLRPAPQHHHRAPLRVDELQQPLPERVPPPRASGPAAAGGGLRRGRGEQPRGGRGGEGGREPAREHGLVGGPRLPRRPEFIVITGRGVGPFVPKTGHRLRPTKAQTLTAHLSVEAQHLVGDSLPGFP